GENEIDAAACGRVLDDRDEVLGLVVDASLGAELLAGAALLIGARRGKDARASCHGELNRGRADAARSAVEERALARFQPAAIEDVGPDGEERFGNRGGVDEV